MPPYGKSWSVDRGIYRDAGGYEVVARVGRFKRSRRFALDTPLRVLREWRDTTIVDLRDERLPTTDASTLAAAIERCLQLVALDMPTTAALRAWKARHGTLQRRKLTPVIALQTIEHWRGDGLKPQTLYYRRLALEKLWRTLDGPRARTPVDDIVIKRPRARRPVWVPDDTIRAVAEELARHEQPRTRKNGDLGEPVLRDAKTRARFMVLASTGQRPSQLRRATPGDVIFWDEPRDQLHGVWLVRAGKGGDPIPVFLNADMRAAWELFIAAKAWGHYDGRNFARTLRRAGWPDGVRPYNVRHATGLSASDRGNDLADIQSHLGHASIATTRGYYVPQLHSRLMGLSQSLEGRFGWGKKPSTP